MYKKLAVCSLLVVLVGIFVPQHTSNLIGTIISSFLFVNNRSSGKSEVRLFTKGELKTYNGIDKSDLYLSILGEVFDVSKGKKHYGPNQQYNVFVGCDASRSFVTGKFDEDISEEVADFTKQELRSLNHWVQFYKKEYVQVGKLIGQYYKEDGKITSYGNYVHKLIKEAELQKENEKEENKQFPPCNIEWNAEQGTKLWCSYKSGGISRDWIGVPRQYYEASSNFRCACIKEDQLEHIGNIKEYDGCDKSSNTCFVKV